MVASTVFSPSARPPASTAPSCEFVYGLRSRSRSPGLSFLLSRQRARTPGTAPCDQASPAAAPYSPARPQVFAQRSTQGVIHACDRLTGATALSVRSRRHQSRRAAPCGSAPVIGACCQQPGAAIRDVFEGIANVGCSGRLAGPGVMAGRVCRACRPIQAPVETGRELTSTP